MRKDDIKQALAWTFKQTYIDLFGEKIKISEESSSQIVVDSVRKYFNDNDIEYPTFDYKDLIPFI